MVPGNYPLHKFYGVIGTRPSFGAGERYPAFNREWTTMGYETISVSYIHWIMQFKTFYWLSHYGIYRNLQIW